VVLTSPDDRWRLEQTSAGLTLWEQVGRRGVKRLERADMDQVVRWLTEHGVDPATFDVR
jgi:hypothetical protein